MNQEEYHRFAFERLGKEFPNLIVKVEYRSEGCYTRYDVSLDSELENPFKDPKCSAVDFVIHRKDDRLSHIWLRLREERREIGLGRKLVDYLGEIAKALGLNKLQVNINVNESFWAHMGFVQVGDAWIKELEP